MNVHTSFNFKMEKTQKKIVENKCFNFCQTEKEAIRQKIYGVPVNVNGFLGKIKYVHGTQCILKLR